MIADNRQFNGGPTEWSPRCAREVIPGNFGSDLKGSDRSAILPCVMNQLIAKVSSVPRVRQLMALRTTSYVSLLRETNPPVMPPSLTIQN